MPQVTYGLKLLGQGQGECRNATEEHLCAFAEIAPWQQDNHQLRGPSLVQERPTKGLTLTPCQRIAGGSTLRCQM